MRIEQSTDREDERRILVSFPLPFLRESKRFEPTFHFTLEGRDRIKIAGAISRAHDTGENAGREALIMAGTRRGSRYHVSPLNFKTLITLMSRQSRALRNGRASPRTFSQSLPIGIMQTSDAKIGRKRTHRHT